ncbi:ABC transporter ATP-binding protein [Archaeoglobus sp.]|uniref:ABC transporter ATP-binding protein n=1 Tax=Archaeoglobus sp. TaxID=1872626 RepID=UPI0024AC3CA7|nr:ABC transporter ATP-binding protein [Archaeoglobus sp.]MDI3497626.1 type transport system ATP-binding protein [Archaeoglobus sp.]
MIEVKGVSKSFGNKAVLSEVSFVAENEILGLLGPNGSGKSTLMKIIAGVIPPDEGDVIVNGVSVAENPLKVKELVGFVPETPVLYESLTASELFSFVGAVRKIESSLLKERVERLAEALEFTAINELVANLSLGNRQKVSIIAAMLHNPSVLILDEAFNGLDVASAKVFRDLIFQFREEGREVILSTHIMPIAERVCDRILIIQNGRIIAQGTPDELKKDEELEDVFLKLTKIERDIKPLLEVLSSG